MSRSRYTVSEEKNYIPEVLNKPEYEPRVIDKSLQKEYEEQNDKDKQSDIPVSYIKPAIPNGTVKLMDYGHKMSLFVLVEI